MGNLRSVIGIGESFNVEAVALGQGPVQRVTLFTRSVAEDGSLGQLVSSSLTHAAKGRRLYHGVVKRPSLDFDYFLEAVWDDGSRARFPEAEPDVRQSVVVAKFARTTVSRTVERTNG